MLRDLQRVPHLTLSQVSPPDHTTVLLGCLINISRMTPPKLHLGSFPKKTAPLVAFTISTDDNSFMLVVQHTHKNGVILDSSLSYLAYNSSENPVVSILKICP